MTSGRETVGWRTSRFCVVAACLITARVAAAQDTGPKELPDAPTAQQVPVGPQKPATPFATTVEVLGKRSMFFPDLAADKRPLTPKRKLELATDESIAPSRILGSAFTAGIGQMRDSLPGYGQEWAGYGKRFGSSLASSASNHLFGTFLLASALRQDPRYFVKLHDSTLHRIGYAIGQVAMTHTDDRRPVFNYSGLLGGLLAESLANSYLPDGERTAGKTFSRFGIRVGLGAVSNVVKEYWPTIFRSLRISNLTPKEKTDPGTVTPN